MNPTTGWNICGCHTDFLWFDFTDIGMCSLLGKPMLYCTHICDCYHYIDYIMLSVYIFMVLDLV